MPSVLTTDDVRRLEAAADNLRDLLMCRLFCLYGPRRSELLALEAQDMHLAEERLRLPVKKRERGVALGPPGCSGQGCPCARHRSTRSVD